MRLQTEAEGREMKYRGSERREREIESQPARESGRKTRLEYMQHFSLSLMTKCTEQKKIPGSPNAVVRSWREN
jgi:hypothetical protein